MRWGLVMHAPCSIFDSDSPSGCELDGGGGSDTKGGVCSSSVVAPWVGLMKIRVVVHTQRLNGITSSCCTSRERCTHGRPRRGIRKYRENRARMLALSMSPGPPSFLLLTQRRRRLERRIVIQQHSPRRSWRETSLRFAGAVPYCT